jgi:hypothetical protein
LRLEMAEQANHVDRASGHQGDDQQLVHRGLQESSKESRREHERDSGQESQSLFFGGFISRLRNPARFSPLVAGEGGPQTLDFGTHERIVRIAQFPYFLLVGTGVRTANGTREIGMAATGFERPAAGIFAAVSLAAVIAAFAIGQAQAQTVNPVPPPSAPTFNPSAPNTVPQAPYVPVSPAPPSGLGSAPTAPGTPAIESPQTLNPPATNPPAPAEPALSRRHAGHHGGVRHRWSKRHARFHAARVLGPSYDPGFGEFYPPHANPCHFSQVWSGYYAGYWSSYGCSW